MTLAGTAVPTGARPLLRLVDAAAAALLAADLAVVATSVFFRYVLAAPLEWSDDVARGLLVALAFFGAAAALARGENIGITVLRDRLPPTLRRLADAIVSVLVIITALAVTVDAGALGYMTGGQTTGSGLPLEWTFYPMAAGAACVGLFALDAFRRRDARTAIAGVGIVALIAAAGAVWIAFAPDTLPDTGWPMLLAFAIVLALGMPIGFALALAALIYIWVDGSLPGVIFAQQMARGIDNFVLLAIPFFILVGYLMEANGMSVRLIALLQRLVGRMRGGLDVVMILAMVVFSGISGSKMADVAAVGSVLVPAARRSGQDDGRAVALLAASAVMAETIPPCINLIILGFVANLSIGGLFVAGLLPAGLMAAALVAVAILFGRRAPSAALAVRVPSGRLWSGAAVTLLLIAIIFGGFKSGIATATEISAFAALYTLVVGGIVFRELGPRAAVRGFVQAASRSGLILFIVAAAQSVAFVLVLEGVPQRIGEMMTAATASGGGALFLILSIAILIVMGSVLEGAAALIIFAPLLVPVAARLGVDGLQFGVVLVIAMGIGLFAPPLGLGLYGACLVGGVAIERTVRPMLAYLALLLACLLLIAFVPGISLLLPRALGY